MSSLVTGTKTIEPSTSSAAVGGFRRLVDRSLVSSPAEESRSAFVRRRLMVSNVDVSGRRDRNQHVHCRSVYLS